MRKLIAGLLVVAMFFVFAGCNRNAVPNFDDWAIHRQGNITVRTPTDEVQIDTGVGYDTEVAILQSTVNDASVSVAVMQMIDVVPFLRSFGATEEFIIETSLPNTLNDGIAGFLAEAGGTVHGRSDGIFNGLQYYRVYGVTDLNDAYFEARVFVYADDFYMVKLFWNDANADIVEPFFQSIRFG